MEIPIYIIKATKAHSKADVCTILRDILGPDSIDRFLSIDALEGEKRVFVIVFWRVPLVNEFHEAYTEPGDTLYGKTMPWVIEQLDPYGIFRDGNFPAPHFLRNSKNLIDDELNELGIGGPGEFVYINLPSDEYQDTYWEMYRDGTYYMPDMAYYNRVRMEPLSVVDRPLHIRNDCVDMRELKEIQDKGSPNQFRRWRDFYIEYPSTWPKDLTEVERATLEKLYDEEYKYNSPWTPECGRDPTNMAEEQERRELLQATPIEREEIYEPPDYALEFHPPPLSRSITDNIPTRELNSSPFPAQSRGYWVDNHLVYTKDKTVYRKFD